MSKGAGHYTSSGIYTGNIGLFGHNPVSYTHLDVYKRQVQSILHLSDAEIMSITRFERGQGLISTNSNHITVSFKASPLEKQLIPCLLYTSRCVSETGVWVALPKPPAFLFGSSCKEDFPV